MIKNEDGIKGGIKIALEKVVLGHTTFNEVVRMVEVDADLEKSIVSDVENKKPTKSKFEDKEEENNHPRNKRSNDGVTYANPHRRKSVRRTEFAGVTNKNYCRKVGRAVSKRTHPTVQALFTGKQKVAYRLTAIASVYRYCNHR